MNVQHHAQGDELGRAGSSLSSPGASPGRRTVRFWRRWARPWCCAPRSPNRNVKPGQDFFPLTVNYQEKTFAAGKIPGGFFKREGRPSEKETLTSRLIDRPIRPLFPDGVPRTRRRSVGDRARARRRERSGHRGDDRRLGGADRRAASRSWARSAASAWATMNGQFILNPTFEQLDGERPRPGRRRHRATPS